MIALFHVALALGFWAQRKADNVRREIRTALGWSQPDQQPQPACPHYATTEHGCRERCEACAVSFRTGSVSR